MADNKIFFKTGLASSLPTTKTAGQLLFAIEGTAGSIYLDKDSNTRIKFNADAAKLATARTINGTLFDGSDNITTDNWGTARNITIGDITKSVNGSQAYSWTEEELRYQKWEYDATNAKLLHTDPLFYSSSNNVNVYNNKGGSDVTITRITAPADCPTASGYCLNIKVTGTNTSPEYGGFFQTYTARPNGMFLIRYLIKLPEGYTLFPAANSMGDDYSDKFITDTKGTGKWTWYVRRVKCGATGTFSTGGHVYIAPQTGAAAPSASTPINWYLGAIYCYDLADSEYTANNYQPIKVLSASKLTTARSINGTSFDGSGDITTSKWGTAQTISISSEAGATGTSINGSRAESLIIPSTMTGFTSITSTTFVGNLSGKATNAGTADSATTASSCTGNAATADKLKTARSITLAGDVTGTTSFDGSNNVSITATVDNDSHNHTYSTVSLLGNYVSNTDYATLPNGITYVEMPATAAVTGDPTYGAMLTVKYGGNRAFQMAGNSNNKLHFRAMHSGLSSDAGTGYGAWRTVALSDGGTYTMNITGNASGTASKLATARSITISGTASSSVGTFDGSDNTTIYMPLTIDGFNEIKTKKLTITGTEQVSHIAFSRGAWNYFTAPTSGAFAFVPNGGTTTNGAGATFVITGTTVQPGEKNNTIDLGTSTYKWKNVYATTFTGALSGNATTATTLATSRALRISDTANSTSTASFNGSADATLYIPTTIKGFTSIESDKFVVNDKVTLQYNTTNECLEFVFA